MENIGEAWRDSAENATREFSPKPAVVESKRALTGRLPFDKLDLRSFRSVYAIRKLITDITEILNTKVQPGK